MPDRYQQLVTTATGGRLAGALGLPVPTALRRHAPGQPLLHGHALLGEAAGGHLLPTVRAALGAAGVETRDELGDAVAACVFDASGIASSGELRALYEFFHPAIRRLEPSARLLVLGTPPGEGDARRAAAQQALEGFSRSLGKEMRRGATVNLLRVAGGGQDGLASALRFFLSGRSAFVSGQVVRLAPAPGPPPEPFDEQRPLAGKVALVTGAAQGIGAAIAGVLARQGAHVVCLDVPAQGHRLAEVANRAGGTALQLDLTAEQSPEAVGDHLRERHGGVDVVVHNAGITRDRTLAAMEPGGWDAVIAVNLTSQERLNEALLAGDVLRPHGRVVCVSSLSGIAGNRGQTNYAASKAGIVGMVGALAPAFAERAATINAVAPGFIESAMTAAMPVGAREAGRRMSSLRQGGLPVDVAETVAWLASPGSAGVNGQTVRVCGQSLLGA